MNLRRNIPDYFYFLLALALAVFMRLVNLGALPLSDGEASWALQALGIVKGTHPLLGSNAAYDLLTAVLFFIFGAGNFSARFWPAIAGSLLVLAPWPVRERLGRVPAILLAFAIAFDPGLMALSRLAGSQIMAVSFLVLAGVFWFSRRLTLAGIFAALAMLSGPAAWFGLVVLLLCWLIYMGIQSLPKGKKVEEETADETVEVKEEPIPESNPPSLWAIMRGDLKQVLPWFLGILIFGGTLFMLVPNGLSAALSSIPDFLRGWGTPSGVNPTLVLLALPAYELMPLVFGLAAIVRGSIKGDRLVIGLGIWFLVAVLLTQAYPGRQVGDLAWALIPLWVLAVLEIGRHLEFSRPGLYESLVTAAISVAMLVFSWMNLAGLPDSWGIAEMKQTHLGLSIGAILLMVLCLLLVGLGWSLDIARRGGVWGSVIALALFTLGMGTGATGLRRPLTAELWQPVPLTGQAEYLLASIDQVSDLSQGYKNSLPVLVVDINSPALRWLLREYPCTEAGEIAVDATPELVIVPQAYQFSQPAPYRGQDFSWREIPAWNQSVAFEWVRWLVFRSMRSDKETIILWVRSDLMPGGDTQP